MLKSIRLGWSINFWVFVVVQSLSHIWLCDPMDCNMPGFPVLLCLPEFAQTYVHWVILSNHLVLSPTSLTFNLSSIRVFSNESVLHITWPRYWSFSFSINLSSEYSGLISFRIDWFDLLAVEGTDSQESSPTLQFESVCSSVLSQITLYLK